MQFIALDTNLITVFQYVKYVTKHCKLDCSQIFQPSALQYSIYCSQASHLALLNEGKDSSTIKKDSSNKCNQSRIKVCSFYSSIILK